ncbi:MAG: DNA glycosylase AlkZ-like family protein [Thermoplasmata archaeon]
MSLVRIGSEDWEEEISLIPPFDNMVFHQARTKELYGFDYVREQFLPERKRKFGTYVLPILWGDRFIGRIDPRLDRASKRLEIKGVHAEPGAPRGRSVAAQLAERIEQLATFLGAETVVYSDRVPTEWRDALHRRSYRGTITLRRDRR